MSPSISGRYSGRTDWFKGLDNDYLPNFRRFLLEDRPEESVVSLLAELKRLVYSYHDGGSKYFSVSHFLASARLPVLQQIDPTLDEEKAGWLNIMGGSLDESDIYEIGIRHLIGVGCEYMTEPSLVLSLIDAHRSKDWEEDRQLHLDVVTRNTVPFIALFNHIDILEPETRPTASGGSWLEERAREYQVQCSNFRAAESILDLAWMLLDPFETPFRYVVPEPEAPVFVRNILSLIDQTDRSEQVSSYRALQKLGKERELVADSHMRAKFDDAFPG